jgi:hypothetical protein
MTHDECRKFVEEVRRAVFDAASGRVPDADLPYLCRVFVDGDPEATTPNLRAGLLSCVLANRAAGPLTVPDTLDELAEWIDEIPACAGVGPVLRLKCREHKRG